MLSKSDNSKKPKKVNFNEDVKIIANRKKMTQKEINHKVNQILSGGKIRKRKIII